MSLLFQIGPPNVELWPFKHLKHKIWTSCQKTFLFLFLQLFFFQTVHFSTLSYRRQNGGKRALVCSSQTVRISLNSLFTIRISLNSLFKKGRCSGCIASISALASSAPLLLGLGLSLTGVLNLPLPKKNIIYFSATPRILRVTPRLFMLFPTYLCYHL